MPPKRKSIGRSTSQARSKNISRASKSVQQRDARLEADRIQTAQARSNETVQQRKARLEDNRIQTAQGRSNESIAQWETRLGTNRERNVCSRRTLHADLNLAAFHYDAEYDYSLHPSVVIGKIDKLCKFCDAFKFKNETPGMCCAGGKVKLPELHLPPEPLSTLISGATSQSKHFLRNIRKYNSCFQMTSFGATEIILDNYMPTFKVQGQICHRVGSLLPLPDSDHKFLQIYFMGTTDDQQYIVDMYVKIETERLLFIRLNQTKLRSEKYIHLRDAIATDGNPNDLGKMIILPATFAKSPRHMHEYAQDAMPYVRVYGRPDLFITFTCNPRWEEIRELMLPGQSPSDRPDIIARVFNQKLRALMHFIVKYRVFGGSVLAAGLSSQCWMYYIEWQKRGLPHAHILIWLIDKITPDQIDQVISAEIPDIAIDPDLFEVVAKNMIHGPCGAINNNSPCMKDGKCTKRYPRDLHAETITGVDGYPQYRRRSTQDGGKCITIKVPNIDIEVDNRWIVPYSPLLSRTFKAHINVEYCNSVKSIKYICKYVNIGSDMAVFGVKNASAPIDEVQRYQLGRYICSNEAVWRILSFSIHERYPTVVHLAVHLENGQRVYFTAENVRERAASPPQTTLTAFFSLCEGDLFAKTLRYSDVPKYYTWNASEKKFQRQSFRKLRTVNDKVCSTYREACQELYLLENDAHLDTTLADASSTAQPHQIRMLFAILLTTCFPSKPMDLWEKYKDSMSEDILHHLRAANLDFQFTPEIYNRALVLIEDICLAIANKRLGQMGLCAPNRSANDSYDRDLQRETHFDVDDLSVFVERNLSKLVPEQRIAYDTLMQAISDQRGGLYFLDAPRGTGKTFLINLILATIRSRNEIAVAIASSGIAATLLDGGRTAHSALKFAAEFAHN
ncbi:hypothetical protein LAZ67_10002729 [Cordylochernes scorpioides]|uniref:ATP-dependent DNA helicase n=1 Tax=Cordylochernes scorpioides TaxID=51811 RepID=A0ABY6L0M4_9ARAC|nr:hypothetical protein LAZ67_10002729 [Cordylochernes scorpioides]